MHPPESKNTPTSRQTRALSNAQNLLWTAQQLYPDAPIYNMAFVFRVEGDIDPSLFSEAFTALVAESDSLRTTFRSDDHGNPVQLVSAEASHYVARLDFSSEPDPDSAFRAWAMRRSQRKLDLSTTTFEVALADLGPQRSAWYFCQHHLVADASAFAILFGRLSELYRDVHAPDPLPRLHYAPESSTPSPQSKVGVADTPQLKLYGSTRPRDAGSASDRRLLEIDPSTLEELDRLIEESQLKSITSDMGRFKAYLAALLAYLYRVSGQSRIEVGVPLLNRPTQTMRRTPGLFTEVFPMAVDIGAGETFDSLFGKIAEATHDMLRDAKPGTASASQNRRLNVNLNYLPVRFGDFAGMPTKVTWVHTDHVEAEHTLRINVTNWDSSETQTVLLDFNRDTVDESTQLRAVGHFETVFRSMLKDPSSAIDAFSMLSPEEATQIESLATGPTSTPPDTILDKLEAMFQTYSAEPALEDGSRAWTYGDLDEATRRVSTVIDAGTRVGVALQRSAEAVVSIVAVMRAGAAFVPIDPTWPPDRISYVLEDSGASLLITDARLESGTSDTKLVTFEELITQEPARQLSDTPSGVDLAYVIYTSGSTGTPKGVPIHHSALANYTTWAQNVYDEGRRRRFPLFTPLTFDLTITSLFVPLMSGGVIRVYPQVDDRFDTSIRAVFRDDAVDVVKLTPSHLALVQDMDLSNSKVGTLVLGGEDLTKTTAIQAEQQFPEGLRIYNEYGPTEATVGCVVEKFDADKETGGASVPIGRPIDNMSAWILDSSGNPVPMGAPGELWLNGFGVAKGYLGMSARTQSSFASFPGLQPGIFYRTGDLARMLPDGTLEYLGRRDDQVKIRGARVELGEVEARLAEYSGVSAVVARVAKRPDRRHNQLVAYYVPDQDFSLEALRSHAGRALPGAMIPSRYIEISRVPLTENGKVDRGSLPEPTEERPDKSKPFVQPSTPTESMIAGVWTDVLNIEQVGADDDFFELGGDSIMAIRIVARCNSLGLPIGVRDVFDNPTIEKLAALDILEESPAPPSAPRPKPSDTDMDRLAELLRVKEER